MHNQRRWILKKNGYDEYLIMLCAINKENYHMRLIYNMIIGMKICYINISGQTYDLSICAKTVLFLYNSKKVKQIFSLL